MKIKQDIEYVVKFQYYRYNTGAGDNGHFVGSINYPSLDRAKEIYSIIKDRLEQDKYETRDFLDSTLGVEGYIVELRGVFVIQTFSNYDAKGLYEKKVTVNRVEPELTED